MPPQIITIGLSPCWDLTCIGEHLEWGRHARLAEAQRRPAGKALNVARALAWMGTSSVAAGLWGAEDIDSCVQQLKTIRRIKVALTAVPGATRQNVTVIDDTTGREMHLRAPNPLASRRGLRHVTEELEAWLRPGCLVVLAGSLPEDSLLCEVETLLQACRAAGSRLVMDTSGPPLRRLLKGGGFWLIKPNVQELGEALGVRLPNRKADLVKAARTLTDRATHVLVSRGREGALLVTADQCWAARCRDSYPAVNTVACGDFLLAGFLHGQATTGQADASLALAVQAGTARAWGLAEREPWADLLPQVLVVLS